MTASETAEAAQRAASFAIPSGASVAVGSGGINYLGYSKDEWTLIFAGIGAMVAVAGLLVSWYYKHKEYTLLMAKIEAGK